MRQRPFGIEDHPLYTPPTHCRVCEEQTRYRQDADASWICEACHEEEACIADAPGIGLGERGS